MKTDKSVQLLKTLRGNPGTAAGLKIVKVVTDAPHTFVFEGTKLALDGDIFEVPATLSPLEKGARYFALPIISAEAGQRWGLLMKIDGQGISGTFSTNDGKTITVENSRIIAIS